MQCNKCMKEQNYILLFLAIELQQKFFCCKTRQLAELKKVALVVRNDGIALCSLGTLVLQHVLEIPARMVDCLTQLLSVHSQCHNSFFYFVKSIVNFLSGIIFLNYVSKCCKSQSRSIKSNLTSISFFKDFFCRISSRPIQIIVKKYVSIKEYLVHLLRIYAKRSSLSISSCVKCPIPRRRLNDSGRSTTALLSTAVVFDFFTRGFVIRRRAIMAFSIMPSSVTMIFNSRNNSEFSCNAVIILALYMFLVAKLYI